MSRSPFHGTRQILQFNWPFYAIAATAATVAVAALRARRWAPIVERGAQLGLVAGAWWSAASIFVSWWIYDVSPLYKWHWLRAYFPENPHAWATFHAGVDDATPMLRELFGSDGAAYDFFDAKVMVEPSIHRARAVSRPEVEAATVDFRALNIESDSLDTAFVMLAAHELRERADRERFFAELRRILKPDGQLIVAEHVRDAANFVAFGPGAFHFFAASEWRHLGEMFETVDAFKITPFVRVWVWRKAGDEEVVNLSCALLLHCHSEPGAPWAVGTNEVEESIGCFLTPLSSVPLRHGFFDFVRAYRPRGTRLRMTMKK